MIGEIAPLRCCCLMLAGKREGQPCHKPARWRVVMELFTYTFPVCTYHRRALYQRYPHHVKGDSPL